LTHAAVCCIKDAHISAGLKQFAPYPVAATPLFRQKCG
jgi:hypothetical protein